MRALPEFVDVPLEHSVKTKVVHLGEVVEERVRAHHLHDGPLKRSIERKEWNDPRWLSVVVEEVGEVAKAINERMFNTESTKVDLRKELIQVMAMCSAWIDAIDMDVEGEG